MKFQDIETGEIRTRAEWLRVIGEDLFRALRDAFRLLEV